MLSLPSNVKIEVVQKTALIRFDKGTDSIKTEIDKFWINGSGTYDELTKGNAFYFEDLELGKHYEFKLRVFSQSGEVLESDIYSFDTEPIVLPTVPTNIKIEFDEVKRNLATVKFTKGTGVKTEIDKVWINGEGTFDEYTTGTAFILGELEWGKKYEFKLRSVGNNGDYAVSETIAFDVEAAIVPTQASSIDISVDPIKQNTVTIKFTKGAGLKTEILFQDGYEKLNTYTLSSSFYLENLDWGKTYNFILKTVSNDGTSVQTTPTSFSIAQAVPPTFPTNIKVIIDEVKRNSATISFDKGQGVKTEIEKLWEKENHKPFNEYTTGRAFHYDNLKWGERHEFILRSVGITGEVATAMLCSFDIEPEIIPTTPANVKVVLVKNAAEITFNKGQGIKTEINKMWIGDPNSYDECTTGSNFTIPNLEYGKKYDFKLRSVGNSGKYAESIVYSIEVPAAIVPTAATNVNVTFGERKANINFTKGKGVCTKIDKFWMGGQGTWDEETTDSGFTIEDLTYNTAYQFILGSFSNTDEIAKTEVISFTTPAHVVPTAPSNVAVAVEATTVTIKFTKGAGYKTEIDKIWVNGEGTWDEYTTSDGFYITGLEFNTKYSFKLRSVGDNEAVAETAVFSFETGSKDVPILTAQVLPPTTKIGAYVENEFEERWFYSAKNDGTPPGITAETISRFRRYNGYYLGDTSKKEIFLTFDEGYETGQTAKILDTLKANDVKAAFFITNVYLNGQVNLVKRMTNEGHLVCNHSSSHPSMANKARESKQAFEKEILTCANAYRALIGKEMSPYFRPPMGKYSELMLRFGKDLGYNTVFWSYGYNDWNPLDQPNEEWAKNYVTNHVHNGAIVLLHAVSKTNANILDAVIKDLKQKGYVFKMLTELPKY